MLARVVSGVVALVATAYVVLLFFPWTEATDADVGVGRLTGLDASPSFVTFATGLVLVLWEVLGVLGVRRTVRSDSLVAFFLAVGTAVPALAAIVHVKWGSSFPYTDDLAPAAFAVIPLAILLLAGATAHLGLHVLADRRR